MDHISLVRTRLRREQLFGFGTGSGREIFLPRETGRETGRERKQIWDREMDREHNFLVTILKKQYQPTYP